MKIGYGRHWIGEEDIKEAADVLRSDFVSQGPRIEEFEKALCEYTGARFCVAVSSGTAALHLAIAALEISLGSEGVTSDMTFIATPNAMIYNGLKPVLCDIDPSNFLIDLNRLKEKIRRETKLVVPVHFAGLTCDMEEIEDIARSRGIYIVEDAAHALGSRYPDGKRVGCCDRSDLTTFSFHPVKAITTGEGGAVTTNDESLYRKMLALRNHGFVKNSSGVNEMRTLGFNYRMTDFQAVIGESQLKKLDGFIEIRRNIAEFYISSFNDFPLISFQKGAKESGSSWHIMVMLLDFERNGLDKNEFISGLRQKGIFTQVHYLPVHIHEYYRKNFGYRQGDFLASEEYYKKALTIPLYPKMTKEEMEYVSAWIKTLSVR
ncbi:UDP-4-amino-4,6-dideoxy-N-acetyl-beta-L-altrosamine transaminase [candidate division WOR-3 bacterium]|nr:UDP-4-amino-4,6-dideoxy-N-acetyl-beta-L-altrosamine transaminase [candidate division WOR-3 bacterium]